MPLLALHILRIHEPHLLRKVEPFAARKTVGLFKVTIKLGRFSWLHVDIYEFDGVIFKYISGKRIASKHELGRLLLPDKNTKSLKRELARDHRIQIKCNVFDMKGGNGYLAFYFQKQDGTRLTTTNRTYRSNERPGQLALYVEISPGYQNTVYEDETVFMPYDELNLRSGNYDLQMDVDLIEKDGTMIQHIEMYNFWYEKDY